jgi:Domain of unknown function (DUF4266)
MMSLKTQIVLAITVVAGLAAAGCATVQPWQRGTLADSCMIFDADGSAVSYMTHWQESREGSMGGFGVQGGGCGCK